MSQRTAQPDSEIEVLAAVAHDVCHRLQELGVRYLRAPYPDEGFVRLVVPQADLDTVRSLACAYRHRQALRVMEPGRGSRGAA